MSSFASSLGSVEGKYKDTQTRLYWVDAENNQVQRWASDFGGAIRSLFGHVSRRISRQESSAPKFRTYTEAAPDEPFTKVNGLPG